MVTVLDQEMFSEAEAARLLRVPQGTLHYWLEGGERRGKAYKPVIRAEARGERVVTWAEFVEAALLRQYRRQHRIPMKELRAFIGDLRDRLGVPFPLAHKQPFVSGRQLVVEAQDSSGLDAEFCLVAWASGQLILTPPSDAFFQRVDWDGDLAAGWHPHDDPASPVRIEPEVRFGRPNIKGISTDVLWEQVEAGAAEKEVADAFDLEVDDVRWATAFELSLRAPAA